MMTPAVPMQPASTAHEDHLDVIDKLAMRLAKEIPATPHSSFDADDLAQEARLAMWRGLAGYVPARGPLDVYLLAIGRRQLRTILYRSRRTNPARITGLPGTGTWVHIVEAPPEGHRAYELTFSAALDIIRCCDRLPAGALFLLCYRAAGHTLRECAERLQLPRMAVVRLHARAQAAIAPIRNAA